MADNNAHGLLTHAGTEVPLKQIEVDIKIIGFVAEVTSSLLYSNNEDNPVEAQFTFPVDDGSAVFRFEAEIEGRHIVAEIQEREQAKLTYEDAVEKGSTAMLLKEDDTAGDIFQCTLGNLPPKTDAKISFSYVIELPQEPDGKIRFTLPTVLNPRYSQETGGTVPAEGASYDSPGNIPYTFVVTASVRGYHKVLSVTSDHDQLKVESKSDNSAVVTQDEDFKFDHDFSFLVEYENSFEPQAILETGNPEADGIMKEDMLMVNFYPKLRETAVTSMGEYIFVIDRSGSMIGERIKNAKEALLLFLKSLPTECYFNVVSFGSSYTSLFNGSYKYTEGTLKEALALLDKMDADMGGTEIYKPMKDIFSRRVIKGYHRQVILLTDGEVSNTDNLIGLVKANALTSRVFSLGIGSGVSTSLIKGVARAGKGKAEFITDGGRIQSKVIALLKCATQPAVSNIELKWNLPEGITAVPIPKDPPTFVSAGERLCLYTALTGGTIKSSGQKCSLTLTGKCDDKPVEYSMTFSATSKIVANPTAPLHRLAAKSQIKVLQSEDAEILNSEQMRYRSDVSLSKIRQNMILLSTNANVISKMTAFVAIDKESKKKVEGQRVRRFCPVPVATQEFSDALLMRVRNVQQQAMYIGCASLDNVLMRGECLDQLCDMTQGLSPQSKTFYQTEAKRFQTEVSPMNPLNIAGFCKRTVKILASASKISGSVGSIGLAGIQKVGSGLYGMFSKVKSMFTVAPRTDSTTQDPYENIDETLDKDQKEPLPSSVAATEMLEMISLQEFNGYWSCSKEVLALLALSEDSFKPIHIVKDTNVMTTLAVIVWLRSKFNKRHDEWEMIEKKALDWLSANANENKSLEELLENVEQILWPNGLC